LIVFRSRLREGVEAEYGPRADTVHELARAMPGFVSSADFASEDGERVTLIEFDSPAHLAAWREHAEHRAAQSEGRLRFFSQYSLQICCVVRESRFDGAVRSASPPAEPAVAVELAGGCACGHVRYTARGVPRNRTLCHCSDCRKASGATPVAWATFARSELVFEAARPRERASSERAHRGFCAECGTQLTFMYRAEPDFVDLAVATLDEPERIPPEDHTWVRSKPGWMRIGDDLPRFERDRSSG
jgi:heme-degrading monooxygenase HmoA